MNNDNELLDMLDNILISAEDSGARDWDADSSACVAMRELMSLLGEHDIESIEDLADALAVAKAHL